MKQERKVNLPVNASIDASENISEIHRNLQDVETALETNAAIIENKVAKQRRLLKLKNETLKELKDIPNELLDSQNWDDLKKSSQETAESVKNTAINELKEANEHLSQFGKSTIKQSSKILAVGKDFISTNSPKIANSVKKSVRNILERKHAFSSKDIELLKQLADLKQQGIISQKEFSETKQKILAKI